MNTNPDDYLILVSVEDNIYSNWQLELLVNSFAQMCMKRKVANCVIKPENICAVVHTNKSGLSKYFMEIVNHYGIKYIRTRNFGADNTISYFERGKTTTNKYKSKNKPCCFGAAFSDGIFEEYKYTVLMDPDMYAYEYVDIQKFPTRRTAIAEHWMTDHPVIDNYPNEKFDGVGVDVKKLLKAMGVSKVNIGNYVPGCCIIWLKREDFSKQLVNAFPGYTDLLQSVCQIVKQRMNWCAEMPSYSMSFSQCGIAADLIHEPEFAHENCYGMIDGRVTEPGALVHYGYSSAWEGTDFTKWQYTSKHPFDDLDILESGVNRAKHGVGRHFFFQMLEIARNQKLERSMEIDNTTNQTDINLSDYCPSNALPTREDMLPLDDYDQVYHSLKSYLDALEGRSLALINTEEVSYVADCDILVTQSPAVLERDYIPRRPKVIRYNIVNDGEEEYTKVADLLARHGYKVNITDEYVLAIDKDLIKEFLSLAF